MKIDKNVVYSSGDFSFQNFTTLSDEIIEQIRVWRNHPDIRKVMYNVNEISQIQHRDFVNSLYETKDKSYWLVSLNSEPLGVMSIVDIDSHDDSGQLGYYIFPQFLNSGIGIEFLTHSLNLIFSKLNFKNLFGRTEVFNKNALQINYLLGFKSRNKIVEINNVKYLEQDCSAKDFFDNLKNLSDNKMLLQNIKDFNKYYKTIHEANGN